VQELEAAMTSLVLENHALKQQIHEQHILAVQNPAPQSPPQPQLATIPQPIVGGDLMEEFFGSMALEEQADPPAIEGLDNMLAIENQPKRRRFDGHSSVLENCSDSEARHSTGSSSFTEVMFFASVGDTDKLKQLVDLGHDPCARRDNGCSALHLACRYGQGPAASLLLKATAGAGVDYVMSDELVLFTENSQLWHNLTPLHLASLKANPELTSLLLSHRATVNIHASTATGSHGLTTPLHIAASLGHLQQIVLLLRAGADLTATMKMPCPPKGLSSAGCYAVQRDPIQLSTGHAQCLLSSWASTPPAHRHVLFHESWLYVNLPRWSLKDRSGFPNTFKRQVLALVSVCGNLSGMEQNVLILLVQAMDQHNRETLCTCC